MAWLVFSDDDQSEMRTGAAEKQAAGVVLSADELVTLARSLEGPVYWAGRRAGLSYELTLTPAGRAFVRYLPAGVEAGDPRADFLTVATYPLPDALAAVRRAAGAGGMRSERLPGGGLVVSEGNDSTSAFFARPGAGAQVEVYAPTPGEALGLALGDRVRPIR